MCATTSNIEHWNKDNFQALVIGPLVTAVKYLASRHVDYIIHTGMPVVTTRGKGFEEEVVKLITDTTGLPATTSIRSAIRAQLNRQPTCRRLRSKSRTLVTTVISSEALTSCRK